MRSVMSKKRKIEVFSAGCHVCEETVQRIQSAACSSCEVLVLDIGNPAVVRQAKNYGVRSIPAVAIDGTLVPCCAGRGPDEAELRRAGLGQPLT